MPGTVHPKSGPRTHQSKAELTVYDALKSQLPKGWTAWHSLRLRNGAEWEGEGDFVVAAPNLGILIVEVKGGSIELRDGMWLQNGEPMAKAPREQAQSFARNLVEAVARRGGEPPPWGIACCFPDCEFSDDAAPASGDLEGLVIGGRQLGWLAEALPALYERAVPKRRVPPIHKWAPKLQELWGDTWVPALGLADQIRDAGERHLRLNKKQLAVLTFAGDSPRAIVRGGAGSGKTVVARELCLRRAREGKRALYLCYTDALGLALDRELGTARDEGLDVSARPIKRYAQEVVDGRGAAPPASALPGTVEAYNELSLSAAEIIGSSSDRPDIVVVDEGQDLSTEDWLLVDELSRDRDLWVFHDSAQDYWSERTIPPSISDAAARLELPEQMRNPPSVARFAALYVDGSDEAPTDVASPMEPFDPDELRLVVARSGGVVDAIIRELDRLGPGVAPRDIAVLTLAGRDRSELLRSARLGRHAVVAADHDDAPHHVVADTFLRFKGLERPIVLVAEVEPGTYRYDVRMHIAVTRASVQAVIVCDEQAVRSDPRLVRLAAR